MCTDCFDDEEQMALAPGEIALLARDIEAQMSGEVLPPKAWAIYFGQESGALEWSSLERIGRALEGARLVALLYDPTADAAGSAVSAPS